MDLRLAIFFNIHALKRGLEQERLSLKGGSSFQPLRQGRSYTAQIQQSRERKTSLRLHSLKSIQSWRVN